MRPACELVVELSCDVPCGWSAVAGSGVKPVGGRSCRACTAGCLQLLDIVYYSRHAAQHRLLYVGEQRAGESHHNCYVPAAMCAGQRCPCDLVFAVWRVQGSHSVAAGMEPCPCLLPVWLVIQRHA